MTQGSVSDTDNFLFSRLPFSRSPSWGAEQTLFSPSSPQLEPCIRTEWARLRPWHSRLSQRFWIMREKNKMMMIVPYKHVARKALNGPLDMIIQCASTSWLSRWLWAEAARTCFWSRLCGWTWASATWVLLRKWGEVLCAVSLRPTLTFSPAGESRSHRICNKHSVCHLKSMTPKKFNTFMIKNPDLHREKNMRIGNWCEHGCWCLLICHIYLNNHEVQGIKELY